VIHFSGNLIRAYGVDIACIYDCIDIYNMDQINWNSLFNKNALLSILDTELSYGQASLVSSIGLLRNDLSHFTPFI